MSQPYYAELSTLSRFPDFVGCLLLPLALLGVPFFFVRFNGGRMSGIGFQSSIVTMRLMAIGAGLGGLYRALQLEPGILFGFSTVGLPSSRAFALSSAAGKACERTTATGTDEMSISCAGSDKDNNCGK